MLVKMLPMIIDKIKVWQKPMLYEHPNCTCLNLWVFLYFYVLLNKGVTWKK